MTVPRNALQSQQLMPPFILPTLLIQLFTFKAPSSLQVMLQEFVRAKKLVPPQRLNTLPWASRSRRLVVGWSADMPSYAAACGEAATEHSPSAGSTTCASKISRS